CTLSVTVPVTRADCASALATGPVRHTTAQSNQRGRPRMRNGSRGRGRRSYGRNDSCAMWRNRIRRCPTAHRPAAPPMPHVARLGDSIFDNGAYVRGGPDVVTHLRGVLPSGWTASLHAVDGAVI